MNNALKLLTIMLAKASHIIRLAERAVGSNNRWAALTIITTEIIISVEELMNAERTSERLNPKVCFSVAPL